MRRRNDWLDYARASAAAEDLAERVVPLEKGLRGPPRLLSRAGFNDAVRSLLGRIANETRGADTKALREAAKSLVRDWGTLGEAQRASVIAAAAKQILKVPTLVGPKVVQVLEAGNATIVRAARAANDQAHRLEIVADLSKADERVVQFAAQSQGSYITDVYGNRATQWEQRARDIVSRGLEQGLGRVDLGKALGAELTGPMLRTSEAYWESVAAIHVARARSYGTLSSFRDAGIETYRWVSVLDEATTEMCRFMHGKEFSTASAVERYQAVADSRDPKAVEDLQPFARVGETDTGSQFLYVETNGRRRVICQVDEPAVGQKDQVGSYSRAASTKTLESMGVTTPPCHGRCRSTIGPV